MRYLRERGLATQVVPVLKTAILDLCVPWFSFAVNPTKLINLFLQGFLGTGGEYDEEREGCVPGWTRGEQNIPGGDRTRSSSSSGYYSGLDIAVNSEPET